MSEEEYSEKEEGEYSEKKEEYSEKEEEFKKTDMTLQLGDIIEIRAPSNELLHENTFFIDYINERRIVLIDVGSLEETQLNKDLETGIFTDESIEQIILLSRSDTMGYARQNNLIPGAWIEIYINGDVSTIITGEITSLEEDQIEIKTIPELDVIYIDFEYKGLPDNIPIKKIVIRDKPSGYDFIEGEEIQSSKEISIEPHIEYLETGEAIIHTEEEAEEQENILELLRQEIAKSKEIIFGEDLEEVEQMVELPENQRRYGIDLQTTTLLDELLSTIPVSKRNTNVMTKIHTLISRYRELRNQYSIFDENGEVKNFNRNNAQLHKPIIKTIQEQSTKISWILPVVGLKKKVYVSLEEKDNIHETDIETFVIDEVLKEESNIKQNMYFNDRAVSDESKYYKLYQQLADYMEPFKDPLDHPCYLNKSAVKTNLESIVDNYDDFNSSVICEDELIKRRYVIQKYDMGLNRRRLQRQGDNDIIETIPMTAPDTMYIKSMIVLPAPVVHWSRVHMPETSILEKANLHQFSLVIFRMLNKNKDIAPFIIDDLEKDLYQDDEFLASMRHYVLSDNLQRIEQDDRFEKFLQAMIPKTKILINLVRKYITQKLSFVAVVQALEPFHLYTKDISYKQYLEIRRFLMEQISNKKIHIEDSRKKFSFLTTYKHEPRNLSFIRLFAERPELLEILLDGYQLPSKEVLEKLYTTSEILKKCITMDKGILLNILLQNLMSSLQMPSSLANIFNNDPIDNMNQLEKIKAVDCHKRVLTKKYTSTMELQKDNGKDIFFDKEYDDTPYYILENYKDERKKMLPDIFQRFLIENLIQKHDVTDAEDMARILIRGKKYVKEGEFAVLVLIPEIEDIPESIEERRKLQDAVSLHKKSIYYYRKNDTWIHNKEIDDEVFIDTQDLFCNIKKECVAESDQCSSVGEVSARIRSIAQNKMKNEFSNRFDLASEDSNASLKTILDNKLSFIQKLIRIKTIQLEKTNNIQYQIGLESTKTTDVIVSPHMELLNRILGQTDFVKKQNDIIHLYDFCCREPMELLSEDIGWKYCRLTNTKFLPAFLYNLAKIFVNGGNYILALEEVCHTHGLLSDSGNAIVDKFSGRVIRAIDFAEEEGYDESGFKISTHAFIQKGELDKAVNNLMDVFSTSDKQVCEGERAQMICGLLEGIGKQIGYDIKNNKYICLRLSSLMCDKLIDTEEKYIKDAKKAEEKKGIKLPPYKKRSQQLILLITSTILFMIIQTEVPSFKNLKVMPGCVKSFNGFPLAGEEDMSGLHYMACVLSKMEKKIEPWNTLERMTVIMIQEQMKKIAIASYVEMDELYLKKREYMIMNEIDEISEEHSVKKWQHFLPPLIPFSLQTTSISPDFKEQLFSAIKKGSKQQHSYLLALNSKIAHFGFSIISSIQNIVKKKELLLLSHSTGTPFLQNVCCNEKEHVPILYFSEEDPEIQRYIKSAKVLASLSNSISTLSKASFLFDPRGRSWEYPPVSQEITETIIYAAFIHFCQLDKGKGVPNKFHAFFTDVPTGFPEKSSLEEKIAFLKRQDKRFSLAQFKELLKIIHRDQIITTEKFIPYHRSIILKDLMFLFDNHKSPIIDNEVRNNIRMVLEKYDKTKLISISNEDNNIPEPDKQKIAALKALKNNLAETIQDRFKPAILSFLKKNGKLSPTEFNRLTNFFDTFISKWDTPDIYQIANFVKNTIYEWTSVFPNMLVKNITNTSRIHSYWGLADVDQFRIFNSISTYYNSLGEFREDPVLNRLLLYVQPKFVDLRLFFQNLPIQEAIQVGGRDYYSFFDKDTINLLLEYIIFSVLHEYIIATNERDLLQLDQVEKKRDNRAKISELSEPQIQSEFKQLDEEYEEAYNNMTEIQINSGNREELKKRLAKMLLAFINITRKNKADIDISYENIASSIRKRRDKEKNRIVERFKNMSEDERKVEDLKKKLKMDEWNVGTQKGIFVYDKNTSNREVMEQHAEEALDIKKHGMRQADFITIYGDTEEEPLHEMIEVDDIDNEIPDEDSNIMDLKKGFIDGQFYSDDESDDDFGDD